MAISLPDYRKGLTDTAEIARKHGIAIGIGLACDAINECRNEKEAKGDGSLGYWEALLDLNHKLSLLLRANK